MNKALPGSRRPQERTGQYVREAVLSDDGTVSFFMGALRKRPTGADLLFRRMIPDL